MDHPRNEGSRRAHAGVAAEDRAGICRHTIQGPAPGGVFCSRVGLGGHPQPSGQMRLAQRVTGRRDDGGLDPQPPCGAENIEGLVDETDRPRASVFGVPGGPCHHGVGHELHLTGHPDLCPRKALFIIGNEALGSTHPHACWFAHGPRTSVGGRDGLVRSARLHTEPPEQGVEEPGGSVHLPLVFSRGVGGGPSGHPLDLPQRDQHRGHACGFGCWATMPDGVAGTGQPRTSPCLTARLRATAWRAWCRVHRSSGRCLP